MAHKLPDLPYAYDALEPYYDEQTVRIHHDKHHQGYVDGLNKAEDSLEKARESGDYSGIRALEKAAAFNGSGHILHTLFWQSMCSPSTAQGKPSGHLAEAIDKDFGSFEKFKAHFSAATREVEGSGWGILAYRPMDGKLVVLQAEKHQNLTQWGVIPILVCDVWEHAYYLKYQNRRAEWVEAFWNIVDWAAAGERFCEVAGC